MKQKYVLWLCCDPKTLKPELIETSSLIHNYDDLNIKNLEIDDPKIRQVFLYFNSFQYRLVRYFYNDGMGMKTCFTSYVRKVCWTL
jgi:hypothetical protein